MQIDETIGHISFLAISVPISMALFVVQEHDIAAAAADDNQSPQQEYKGSAIC